MTGTQSDIGPDLVLRARRGDQEALRTLVERAYPLVRRWALVRTGDAAEADDLTQDVLVHVIRKLDTFQGTSRFATWLYSVTRNAAADRYRRSVRRRRGEADPRALPEAEAAAPVFVEEEVHRGRIGTMIRASFLELPPRQREVFDLADLQGLSSVQIAERLGIEPVSVRAHLFKARRAIRARILEQDPDLMEELA